MVANNIRTRWFSRTIRKEAYVSVSSRIDMGLFEEHRENRCLKLSTAVSWCFDLV